MVVVKSASEYEETIRQLKMELHVTKNELFRAQQQLKHRHNEHQDTTLPTHLPAASSQHVMIGDDFRSQFQTCIDEIRAETAGSIGHALNKTACRLEGLQQTVADAHRLMSDILSPIFFDMPLTSLQRSSLTMDVHTITSLRMECHELQEAAKHTPARREIRLYQLQNEALQQEVEALAKSIKHRKAAAPKPRATTPTQDAVPAMMRQDKLLRQLRCVQGAEDDDRPRLMLDADGDLNELPNDVRQRAGLICIDMVAEFCHRFGLDSVVDLPVHVKHVRRLSRTIPVLVQFVERVEVLAATGEKASMTAATSKGAMSKSSLDELYNRVSFLVHDYMALQKHLAPPQRAIHLALAKCMHVLNVPHIDDIVPTIVDLIAVTGSHRDFVASLRQLVGLSDGASRADILAVLGAYLAAIGLGNSSGPGHDTQ